MSSLHDAAFGMAASGDLLAAYDAEVAGMTGAPLDLARAYRAVLLLARSGATQHAQREYERLGLATVADDEKIISLGARLLKDRCLAAHGEERRRLARAAADRYAEAYRLHAGYYPGINVATMELLAGVPERARAVAGEVLRALATIAPVTAEDRYYVGATKAEAHVLLGDARQAAAALTEAIGHDPRNLTARASTLRQLETLLKEKGEDQSWLDPLRPPIAIVYSGHMFLDSGAPAAANALQKDVEARIRIMQPAAAFGALAAGADIVIAEAALADGAALHVILPMREEDFLERSVKPFGASWVARYHACKARAASFRLASHEPNLGEDSVFAYSADYAMGLAIRHAEMFATHAVMFAVWDGVKSGGVAGTGADLARWRATGRISVVVDCPAILRANRPVPVNAVHAGDSERSLKAILFADVRGFSKLQEGQIRLFVDSILKPLAEAIEGLAQQPELVATWGDGLHFVFTHAKDAAAAAIAAQQRFSAINLTAAGLPDHLALRIGGHFGPVANVTDPFLKSPSFFGTHITIAARIEPVALPGSIYISEPFAAALALDSGIRFGSDYVGQTELPKKFGTMRLFSLRQGLGA